MFNVFGHDLLRFRRQTFFSTHGTLFPLFNRVKKELPLKKEHLYAIPRFVKLILNEESSTYIAISGNWHKKNPVLLGFLAELMEGHAVVVEKNTFDRLSEERNLPEKLNDWWEQSVKRWGSLEGVDVAAPGIAKFLGSAGKFGYPALHIFSWLAQPIMAVYETVDSVKDLAIYKNQKNWVVIDDDNYWKVISTLACMHEHVKGSFGDSMAATLMGPQYFWEKWYFRNKRIGQVHFWQSKEQLLRQHLKDRFLQELRTHDMDGWVTGMQKEIGKVFNPNLPILQHLPYKEREGLSTEIRGFSEDMQNVYGWSCDAFMGNEGMRRKIRAYWRLLLSERAGVYNPDLLLTQIGNTNYTEASEEFNRRYAMLASYALATAGVTAIFFLWDYGVAPYSALFLRLLTYGLPEALA